MHHKTLNHIIIMRISCDLSDSDIPYVPNTMRLEMIT